MVTKDRWAMPVGLRRASALLAIVALAVGGAKVAGDHTLPGSGFSTVATVAADPSGPTGGPGGDGGMNGSQFQPPGLPPQQPDYQGGINQPPLDQNSGISIYNSGNPQAPQQVPGQQAGQQPQQAQQPAHGTQIPDYQTATPYTQGPGKANPDYQAPQQNAPQQGQQSQQSQQGQQQSQQPQNQQSQTQDGQDQQDQQIQQQCQSAAGTYGLPVDQLMSVMAAGAGAAGSVIGGLIKPGRDVGGGTECNCAPDQAGPQKSDSPDGQQKAPRSDQEINCTQPSNPVAGDDLDDSIPGTGLNIGGDPKPGTPGGPKLNGTSNPLNSVVPKGTRPIPTGTALGPNGEHYAFYSQPKLPAPGQVNDNYVTMPSQIVDLAHNNVIIGQSPLAQTSGAYDPASHTMLLAGNTSATPGDPARALYQSDPIKPTDGPNDWIKSVHYVGPLLSGDRESQLIALGPEGKNGFMFVSSSGTGPIEAIIASSVQELTTKTATRVLVPRDVNNINGLDGPYGPTITSQSIDPATGNGTIGLKVSQYWDPAFKAAHPDVKELPYDPRVYSASCTVQ
ncbi:MULTISPECIES: hypothetical protein [Mycobacteroides]|uniref:Uncharacterized protein n=1 Tax=Mycobacteroides chelonae TaxID=1774 RepID=A0A1S1LE28_MYCCH|nr:MULTISPECIES: hypothetical protein [Mycobacteroides]KRQ19752.1 hypothetical protein AOT87_19805 [Mycobacteroides sp. H003]KRQ34310.1 hypothetical protein AOT91_06775 [Mycobacteroides sp. H092]KRQ45594.1 hypothetical protein AOT88_19830 [Mycobacteroides sp. H063]KRQ47444.1 hypothetical protein AOT92_00490 [Mycobacteroides sp. H101]KRQ54175.1 hypothetical protein AOT94_25615 [Mycobacteroides sp. HXVII]